MIGLGQVGLSGHLPAWKKRPDFQIVAGVDSSEERIGLFKQAVPEAATFKNLEDCLSGAQLDFVDIATPPHTHFALIQSALQAGLHVLCEKPLVLKKEELARLKSDRQKSGKVLMSVHNWKYAPICRKLMELLNSRTIGEIQRMDWYVLRSGPAVTTLSDKENWRLDPARAGGGILVDHGWHAFYLVLEWMGLQPSRIEAILENRHSEDLPVEDTAKVRIEFSGGPAPKVAEVFLTWASRLRKNSGLIEGSQGRIHIEDDRLIVDKRGLAPETLGFEQPLSQGSHHPEWFQYVIDEFLTELTDPALAGKNLEIAEMCLTLIEKSKESSEKSASIPLS